MSCEKVRKDQDSAKEKRNVTKVTGYFHNLEPVVVAPVVNEKKDVWLGFSDFPPLTSTQGQSTPPPSPPTKKVEYGCPREMCAFSYADRTRAVVMGKEKEKEKDMKEHLLFCKKFFTSKENVIPKGKQQRGNGSPDLNTSVPVKEKQTSSPPPPPPSDRTYVPAKTRTEKSEKSRKNFAFSDPNIVKILSDDECDDDVVLHDDDDDDTYVGIKSLFCARKKKGRTSTVGEFDKKESDPEKEKENLLSCNALQAQVGDYSSEAQYLHSKFYVEKAKIEGKIIDASFVDSGADVCLLPEKCAIKAGINIDELQKAPPISLSSYSNHEINAKCSVWVELELPNMRQKIKHIFLVTSNDSDLVVLSKHLLTKYCISLEKRKKGWALKVPYIISSGSRTKETEKENTNKIKGRQINSDQVSCTLPATHASSSSSSSSFLRPFPKRPKKKQKVGFYFVPVSMEREGLSEGVVVNTSTVQLQPFQVKTIPVFFPSHLTGSPVPTTVQIYPWEGSGPAVYVPVRTELCKCSERCGKYLALIKNTSDKACTFERGTLKGHCANIDRDCLTLTVEQATSMVKKPGCMLGHTQVQVFSLQTKNVFSDSRHKQNFDINESDQYLFDLTSDYGTLDEETGLPVAPTPLKNAADAFDWPSYTPKVAQAVHELFIERGREKLIAKSKLDIGNASARGLGKLRLLSKEPPKKTGPKVYPLSRSKKIELMKILQGLSAVKLIKRVSASTYGSPIFLIPKRETGTARLLIDMRRSNQAVISAPTAPIESPWKLINDLGGSALYSCLDVSSAYFHLRVEEESAFKNAVMNTPLGSFAMLGAPQGCHLVPAIWSSCMLRIICDDPITGDLQQFSMPKEYQGLKAEHNPFSPLSTWVRVWLDDVIIFSPKLHNDEATFNFHKVILSRVLEHFHFYDLRLSIKKCQFFSSEVSLLGYTIKENTVTPDKKRFSDVAAATFPRNKTGLQSFLGLVNTLRHCMPSTVHQSLSQLYELTSVKREFRPTEHHRRAFEAVKRELTSDNLVTYLPDCNKLKLLYTDASQTLLGGVLLEVDLDKPIKTSEQADIPSRPFSIYDKIGRKTYKYCHGPVIQLSQTEIVSNGNCFYHAVLDQLQLYGVHSSYANSIQDLRILITSYLKCNQNLRVQSASVRGALGHKRWHDFCDELAIDRTPTDELGLCIQAAADFIARDIVIVTSTIAQTDPIHVKSNTRKANVAPIFLGLYVADNNEGIGHYVSLVVKEKNILTGNFTSFENTRNWRELSKEEIFSQIKSLWGKININNRPTVRVLSYFTKSISPQDQKEPIYVLELKSLLYALHNYHHITCSSPAHTPLPPHCGPPGWGFEVFGNLAGGGEGQNGFARGGPIPPLPPPRAHVCLYHFTCAVCMHAAIISQKVRLGTEKNPFLS